MHSCGILVATGVALCSVACSDATSVANPTPQTIALSGTWTVSDNTSHEMKLTLVEGGAVTGGDTVTGTATSDTSSLGIQGVYLKNDTCQSVCAQIGLLLTNGGADSVIVRAGPEDNNHLSADVTPSASATQFARWTGTQIFTRQ